MKNQLNNFILPIIIASLFFSCNKNAENISDNESWRDNRNEKTYPVAKLDSAQAIAQITTQKTQELLDLAALYRSGNGDSEIDSVIFAQMQTYFEKPDSLAFKKLFREIDSLNAKNAKVSNLNVHKEIIGKDTVNFATFDVEYFNQDSRAVGTLPRTARFTMKLKPVQFKKEFKFFFEDLDYKVPNEKTSSGVTK